MVHNYIELKENILGEQFYEVQLEVITEEIFNYFFDTIKQDEFIGMKSIDTQIEMTIGRYSKPRKVVLDSVIFESKIKHISDIKLYFREI